MTTATLSAPAADRLIAPVRDFLQHPGKNLINGQWVDAANGQTFEVFDPSTGEVVAHVARGEQEDVNRAVAAARKAFNHGPWRQLKAAERQRLVWKLGDLLMEHLEEFAQLEALDNGKPVTVARVADVPLAAEMFQYMAGWATKLEGNTIDITVPYTPREQRFHAYTRREPIGVAAQIIPWNFPLLMAAWKLAPALAAGCTVVLKPAEQTPLSALRLGELICEAGLPEGVVNIVTGFGETAGAALANHDDVDKVAFTGSTEVGKIIVKAAAGNLKKVTLELGGKSPNIILPDADMEAAIPGAANAIFFNHGQCCAAGSRLFAPKKDFDRVVEGIASAASQIKLGPGLADDTQMGPLVSQEQFNRVTGFLDSGKEDGARAAAGGGRHGERGYFVQPTVLTDVNAQMKCVREEIFGPVVTCHPYDDLDEIAADANNTRYGLAAGIWTRDVSKAHALAEKLRAGTVWVNCYNVFDAALPFGGYKESGWGREMGHDAVDLYTEKKAICLAL